MHTNGTSSSDPQGIAIDGDPAGLRSRRSSPSKATGANFSSASISPASTSGSRFVQRHPHLKSLLTDLLIGDPFKDDIDVVLPLIDEMRREMKMASV